MVLKIYDKMMDLLAREGRHLVGSRVSEILGSKRHLSTFNMRLRKAQSHGMTRVELSICPSSFQHYPMTHPSVKTLWHAKLQVFLAMTIRYVFNDEAVLKMIYRKLTVPILIGKFGQTCSNLLIIGR